MIDLDDMEILDETENERLVKVDNDIFENWRLLINKCGDTYMLKDEQGPKPDTVDEARDFNWIDMEEWAAS